MQRISPKPSDASITRNHDLLASVWDAWFQSLYDTVRVLGNHGTTVQRPTANLYVGQDYFDSTLGYKVTIKSLNPTVWVNGAGSVV